MIQISLKHLFSWLFVKSVRLQRHPIRSQRAVKGRSSAVRRREWLWNCRGIWVVNPAGNLTTEAWTATTLRAGEFPCALLVFYQILPTSKYMQYLNVFYTVLHCIGEALFQTSVTYSLKQHGNICSYFITIVSSCTCLSVGAISCFCKYSDLA